MSFFPYHDASKPSSKTSPQPYGMEHSLPPMAVASQRAASTDEMNDAYNSWGTPASTAGEGFQSNATASASWPQQSVEPRGLGLQVMYTNESHDPATTMAMTNAWSSSFETSMPPACTLPDPSRPDSAIDYCEPFTTSMIANNTVAWDHVAATTAASYAPYESTASPDPSTIYSGASSSRPSLCESSPYARSDIDYPTASPPYIKIEDPATTMDYSRRPYALPGSAQMLVNPGDVYSSPLLHPYHLPHNGGDAKPQHMSRSPMHLQHQRTPSTTRTPSVAASASADDRESSDTKSKSVTNKRSFTTQANSTCSCEECGKLFQRSYNLKAHMETHKPNREHPHVCQEKGCGRRFVRNTDLGRHYKSVHEKSRQHVCHLCSAGFPRKDTLRRHIEDGCSKRAKVEKRGSRAGRGSLSPHGRRAAVAAAPAHPQQQMQLPPPMPTRMIPRL